MEILHANIIVFIKRHYEVCNVNKFNVISHHTSSITCIHHQSYKVKLDYMYEVCNVNKVIYLHKRKNIAAGLVMFIKSRVSFWLCSSTPGYLHKRIL